MMWLKPEEAEMLGDSKVRRTTRSGREAKRPRAIAFIALSVLVASCAHTSGGSGTTREEGDQWRAAAQAYLRAESGMGSDAAEEQAKAARALIRAQLPSLGNLAQAIDGGGPGRELALVAVMVNGTANADIARAIWTRWREMSPSEKLHALRAIDVSEVRNSDAMHELAVPALLGEESPKIQIAALLALRGPVAGQYLPVLVDYSIRGTRGVRGYVLAVGQDAGGPVVAALKRALADRGANEALRDIEALEAGAPQPVAP